MGAVSAFCFVTVDVGFLGVAALGVVTLDTAVLAETFLTGLGCLVVLTAAVLLVVFRVVVLAVLAVALRGGV